MRNARAFSLGVALTLTLGTLPAVAQTAAQPVSTVPPAGSIRSHTDHPAARAFWVALNDTSLNRLLDEAMRGSPLLRAASAEVDRAGASRLEAALDLAPRVTASVGYTRRRIAAASFPGGFGTGALPDQDLWDSGLTASWELDVFGRVRNGVGARSALVGASGEDLRYTQVVLAADVAGNYFALRGVQQRLAVARRNAENQRRTLELTETRLAAGRGTAFDTERARALLSTTLAAIPSLEAGVAALQHRIGVLLGRDPAQVEGDLSVPAAFPAFPADVPAGEPDDVVRTRPDVLGADAQLTATRSLVRSVRADFMPRISLAANAGYLANRMGAFGNTGTLNFTLGPVLSWAAFDLGRVKARADQAQADELAARAHYDQVVLEAREELTTAAARYRAARERLAYLRDASAAGEHAAALARLRYEGGVADFLQVLDAERTLLAAQDQEAQAEAEVADAYVALARAHGADWRGEAPPAR
jgi:NodT family efflux transporter outer membrane factor (OMF) lipoprotein